jgi:uncharacterized membrane protein YgdD (TMEM256/DUF423 family)
MNSSARFILSIAGLLLALAVVLGAVGTHTLRARLSPDQLGIFETAVRYHFYNALGLLAIGVIAMSMQSPWLRWSAGLIIAGIVLFSGALYLAALGAPRIIHVLPPFGGMAWIAGWLLFAFAIWRAP